MNSDRQEYTLDTYITLPRYLQMIRTQVYLTADQVDALRSIAQRSGRKQSELIRDALDAFIDGGRDESRDAVLSRVAGMWKDRRDLPDFNSLRSEWDRDERQ